MKQSFLKRTTRKLTLLFFNNIFVNQFFILFGKENWIQRRLVKWSKLTYDHSKSPGENVGFSEAPEIRASRDQMHVLLRRVADQYLEKGDAILEVGCGTGLFLAPLQNDFSVTGIDLNRGFLAKAVELAPKGKFIEGNYSSETFNTKFKLIFLESSLQYFMPGELKSLFRKFHDDLYPGGILLIHYSHALSLGDVFYADLRYVRYSPKQIEDRAKKYFTIIEHHHYIDKRVVSNYDTHHYYFPGGGRRIDTNLNTYLLIAQRKQ